MHFHSDAWNACFKGEKLYALLPPEAAVYSVSPLQRWPSWISVEKSTEVSFHPIERIYNLVGRHRSKTFCRDFWQTVKYD
jgi:hypothetical protein